MSKHHLERCSCGAVLKTVIELDTGLCLPCLQHEQLYEDHEHYDPDRLTARIDAARDAEKYRIPSGELAAALMRLKDRRLKETYGIDAGLARDDERQRHGNKECS